MSLHDWIQLSEVEKLPHKFQQNYDDGGDDYDDVNEADSDNENEIDSQDKDDKDTFERSYFIPLTPCEAIKGYGWMGSKFC